MCINFYIILIGDVKEPYAWAATILPLQVMRLGYSFYILSVPVEMTTMAGRRLRQAMKSIIVQSPAFQSQTNLSDDDVVITIAGLSNSYSSYVTTYEEYQAQRYEAASTLYGPHTLDGYIQGTMLSCVL